MSLRRYLLTGIAIVLLLAGAVTASIGGYGMQDEVHELLDQHLIQIAQLAVNSSPADLRSLHTGHRGGNRPRNADTELIVQRWNADVMTPLLSRRSLLPQPTQPGFSELQIDGRNWRSYAMKTFDGWVAVAQPSEARKELINGAILMAILPSLLALVLIGWIIALLIRRALHPLQQLTQSLEQRPAFNTEPLPMGGLPQEILPLITAFNRLLSRVNAAVSRERNFVTDAAHALRTPITVLQLQAESLQEARSRVEHSERLHDLISGIARGRHTVEQLLTLARAEQPAQGTTEIRTALKQLPERFNAVLKSKNLTINVVHTDSEAAWVRMHPQNFNVVIDNLLDNAIRYSLPDKTIAVSTHNSPGRIRICVQDHGLGLSPREIEQVFDRFYRPRDDATAGTGLGLAIVRALCEAAGGRAWLELPVEHSGVAACIELPTT